MSGFEAFHFLRPAWLLMLLPGAYIVLTAIRGQDQERAWRKLISPGMFKHLVLASSDRPSRLRPSYLLAVAWLLSVIALSGPSWQREPTPFTEDQSALIVVMKVTPEMLAEDIQPTRLGRAAQKLGDLLELRPGAKTGLVAYAGSAHLVMPLTSDPEIINYFAGELAPDVMPVDGDNPIAAIELASRRLSSSGLPGSIVVMADYFDPSLSGDLSRLVENSGIPVQFYATAAGPAVVPPPGSPPAPALDLAAMKKVARAGRGQLVLPTADAQDVRDLHRHIESSIAAAPLQQGERWKDAGLYLLLPICVLVLPFFRKGGGVVMR